MHIRYKYMLCNTVIIIRCNVNSNSNGRRYSSGVTIWNALSRTYMVWRCETISNYNPKPTNCSEQSNRMINHIVYF